MAKIAFSKLGLTKDKLDEFQTVEFNDQTVEVKQYLPIAEKAELISRVLNNSVDDDAGYYNNLKLDMWLALEIVYAYSNISFTEKQKSDPMKLYDLLSSNKLLNLIIGLVPESEFYYLTKLSAECTAKRMVPDYISNKIQRELKNGDTYTCMGCRSFLTPDRTTQNYAKALNYDEYKGHKYYGRLTAA